MKIAKHIGSLFLFTVLAFAADDQDGKHAYLEVVLQNLTGREIDETAVVFGKHRCTSGVLGTGAHKAYLGWQSPVRR
jgi:hypothetical protein